MAADYMPRVITAEPAPGKLATVANGVDAPRRVRATSVRDAVLTWLMGDNAG